MGKTGRKNKTYSTGFKINVTIDMRGNHLGLRETERKYNVDHHVIAKRERIYFYPLIILRGFIFINPFFDRLSKIAHLY